MINGQHPNYINIMNWSWEHIPFISGYKASYMALFLGIVDSINRNRWEDTKVSYELLINKCGISKQVYLDGRQWLINHDLLEVEFGKNGFQMAKFNLGTAVRKQTGKDTGNSTSTNGIAVRKQTGTNTQVKTVNRNKTLNNKQEGLCDEERILNTNGKKKTPGTNENVTTMLSDDAFLPLSKEFIVTWNKWLNYKKSQWKFIQRSLVSEETSLNHLKNISNNQEKIAAEIINKSIANGWKGFFELKNNLNGNGHNHQISNVPAGDRAGF